jgi:hypothetical protein
MDRLFPTRIGLPIKVGPRRDFTSMIIQIFSPPESFGGEFSRVWKALYQAPNELCFRGVIGELGIGVPSGILSKFGCSFLQVFFIFPLGDSGCLPKNFRILGKIFGLANSSRFMCYCWGVGHIFHPTPIR